MREKDYFENKPIFQKDKAYRLIRVIVIIIATISIGFGLIRISNYNDLEKYYLDKHERECENKQDNFMLDYCIYLLNEPGKNFDNSMKSIGIGAGLLILFFGGTKLYKYLYFK